MSHKLIDCIDQVADLVTKLESCDKVVVDCESVCLGREHRISLVNVALEDRSIYLVDVQTLGEIPDGLKKVLENPSIHKVMYDCRGDADSLYHKHGVHIQGVLDMQLRSYAVEYPDLRSAQPLPSFLFAVGEHISKAKESQLKRRKPVRRGDTKGYEKWAKRPLESAFVQYVQLNMSLLLDLWAQMSLHGSALKTDVLLSASQRYAENRINDANYTSNDRFKNHRFMPLDVLVPEEKGPVACVKCGIMLPKAAFSEYQIRMKVPKCKVCIKV